MVKFQWWSNWNKWYREGVVDDVVSTNILFGTAFILNKINVHDCLWWREKTLRLFSHDWSLISYFSKLFWVNASAGGWGECVSTNIYFASVNNNGNSGKYKKMIYKNASNLTFLIKRFAGANRRDIKILLDKFLYWTVCGRKPSRYKNTVSI